MPAKDSKTPHRLTQAPIDRTCPLCRQPQDYKHLHQCCFHELREGGKDSCPGCGQEFELIRMVLMYQQNLN